MMARLELNSTINSARAIFVSSEVFFSDMLGFLDMTKFNAFNFFNPTFNTRLSSHYLKKAIEDVWKSYPLRFDAIRKKIEFTKAAGKMPP